VTVMQRHSPRSDLNVLCGHRLVGGMHKLMLVGSFFKAGSLDTVVHGAILGEKGSACGVLVQDFARDAVKPLDSYL
jgi:hypothetical protein